MSKPNGEPLAADGRDESRGGAAAAVAVMPDASAMAASRMPTADGSGPTAPGSELTSQGSGLTAQASGLDAADAFPSVAGYEITGPLGHGGMGTVWRAVQVSTKRQVALKLLGPGLFASGHARRRFDQEVELTARLEHHNIARVYESGLDRGIYFYAMELVDGVPLDRHVAETRPSTRQVLALVRTVCEAVQHAHLRGVIHRDLKPGNILVDKDGRPRVVDFGLAKQFLQGTPDAPDDRPAPAAEDARAGDVPPVTIDGQVAGTLPYMSPEQAAGRQLDVRTDVYSLGVILYQLLTGRSPHDLSGSREEVLHRITAREVARPRQANAAIDGELETLLLKALSNDRDHRYASAGEMAADIDNYLKGEPLTAKQATTFYFLRKKVRKYFVSLTLAALGLLSLAGVGIFAAVRVTQEKVRAVKLEKETALNMARAQAQEREAHLRLADRSVAQADALAAGHRWREAMRLYEEARGQYAQLNASVLPAELGLWDAYRSAPPPLLTLPPGGVPSGRGLAGVDVSPDGARVASGGDDGVVRLWDLRKGILLRELRGHERSVTCVAFSPQGSILLSASADGTLRLWDAAGRSDVLRGHDGAVTAAFSRDGGRIVSAGGDGTVRLWDVADGRDVGSVRVGRGGLTCVRFMTDRPRVVVLDTDRSLWSLEIKQGVLGEPTRLLEKTTRSVGAFAVSPMDSWIVTESEDAKHVFLNPTDGKRGQSLAEPTLVAATCFAFARDGRQLLVGYANGDARLWKYVAGKPWELARTLVGHSGAVAGAAFTPDGRVAVTAGRDGLTKVWGLTEEPGAGATGIAGGARPMRELKFSGDGRLLMARSLDGQVRLLDTGTGKVLLKTRHPRNALSGFAHGRNDYALDFWLPPAAKDLPPAAAAGAVSPDGSFVITADEAGRLLKWNAATQQRERDLGAHAGGVTSLAVSPDGRRVFSGGADGRVLVWDARAGGVVLELHGHAGPVRSVVVSADGARALSGGDDGTGRLWEVDAGREECRFTGDFGAIAAVAMDRTATVALVGPEVDTRVRVIHLGRPGGPRVPREVRAISGHAFGVSAAAFGPEVDGRPLLASCDRNHNVMLCDLGRVAQLRATRAPGAGDQAGLARDPKDAAALASLAAWYAFRGVPDWSAGLLKEAAERDPASVSPLALARSLWQAGDSAGAAAAFRRAIERREAPEPYLRLCAAAAERADAGELADVAEAKDLVVRHLLGRPPGTVDPGTLAAPTDPLDPPPGARKVDLFALVDPQRDFPNKKAWQLLDGAIKSAGIKDGLKYVPFEFPYVPPEEYDYEIEFTRHAKPLNSQQGNAIIQMLSKGGVPFEWNMAGWGNEKFGLDEISGLEAQHNETTLHRPGFLKDNRRHRSLVRVRKGRVQAWLNGELMVDWDRVEVLGPNLERDKLQLGVRADRPTTLHSARVVEVTGAGTVTREATRPR